MCIYYIYQYAHCSLALASEPNTTCGGRTVVELCAFAAQGGECKDVHGWTEIARYEGRCLPCRTGLGKPFINAQAREIGNYGWQWVGDKFEWGAEKIYIPVPLPMGGPPLPVVSQKTKRMSLRNHLVAAGGVVGRVLTGMEERNGEVIDPQLMGVATIVGRGVGGFNMEEEVGREVEVGGEKQMGMEGKGFGVEKISRANGLSGLGEGEIGEGNIKGTSFGSTVGIGEGKCWKGF